MGADFTLTSIVEVGDMKLEEREKLMIDYARNIEDNQITLFLDFYEQFHGEDSLPDDVKKIRKDVIDCIREFFEAIDSRDVTLFSLGNSRMILTGGMSWGDAPTDSYDVICRFNELPDELLKLGGFTNRIDILDLFVETYKNKLSPNLKKQLLSIKTAEQI